MRKTNRKARSRLTPIDAAAALADATLDPFALLHDQMTGEMDAIEAALEADLPAHIHKSLLSDDAEHALYQSLDATLSTADERKVTQLHESVMVRRQLAREAAFLAGFEVGRRLRTGGQ